MRSRSWDILGLNAGGWKLGKAGSPYLGSPQDMWHREPPPALWPELPSSGSEGSVGLTYIEHRSFLSTLSQSEGKPGIPQRSSLGGRGVSKFCQDLETPR